MNKKLLLVGILLIILGYSLIFINKIDNKKENNKKVCTSSKGGITGGGFNLSFETNSTYKMSKISVCIACSPDSYDKIKEPKKEGYKFDGWYYDKNFKNKFSGTSTLDIKPKVIYDSKCYITGYEDITLYAKWIKSN